jgi:hypothetical protein
MTDIKRISPVIFQAVALEEETREHWHVVLRYKGEGTGTHIIDLSHRPRFDCQSSDLSTITPMGMNIPGKPGESVFENGILINRMNNTQASIFNLAGDESTVMPDETFYTDVSEATLCVAIIGEAVFSICEKLTALDFADPRKSTPFLFQGPFSHVPCQIITMSRNQAQSGIILTCSRGYGRDMTHSIMDAGKEFDLKPAGEKYFTDWMNEL